MTTELTSSVRAAGPILQVLAEGGVNLGQVGARLGIDPTVFADQDARIPISKLVPLWDVAEELLDDAFVGLHVAQRVSRETFDIFSYIACASANLGEALARIERYFRLITDGGNYETRRVGDEIWRVEFRSFQNLSALVSCCTHRVSTRSGRVRAPSSS